MVKMSRLLERIWHSPISEPKHSKLEEKGKSDSGDYENVGPEILSKGVTFYPKYLGCCEVSEYTGEKVTAQAIRKIIAMARKQDISLVRVALTISLRGIRMIELNSLHKLLEVSIYRVSYCSTDATFDHVFGFICTNADSKLECHAFICPKKKMAQEITLTIAEAFNLAYDYWKQYHRRKRKLFAGGGQNSSPYSSYSHTSEDITKICNDLQKKMKDCKPIKNKEEREEPEKLIEDKNIKSAENKSSISRSNLSNKNDLTSNIQTENKKHNKEETKNTMISRNTECKSPSCPIYCLDRSICCSKQSQVNDKKQHNQTFSSQTLQNINPAQIQEYGAISNTQVSQLNDGKSSSCSMPKFDTKQGCWIQSKHHGCHISDNTNPIKCDNESNNRKSHCFHHCPFAKSLNQNSPKKMDETINGCHTQDKINDGHSGQITDKLMQQSESNNKSKTLDRENSHGCQNIHKSSISQGGQSFRKSASHQGCQKGYCPQHSWHSALDGITYSSSHSSGYNSWCSPQDQEEEILLIDLSSPNNEDINQEPRIRLLKAGISLSEQPPEVRRKADVATSSQTPGPRNLSKQDEITTCSQLPGEPSCSLPGVPACSQLPGVPACSKHPEASLNFQPCDKVESAVPPVPSTVPYVPSPVPHMPSTVPSVPSTIEIRKSLAETGRRLNSSNNSTPNHNGYLKHNNSTPKHCNNGTPKHCNNGTPKHSNNGSPKHSNNYTPKHWVQFDEDDIQQNSPRIQNIYPTETKGCENSSQCGIKNNAQLNSKCRSSLQSQFSSTENRKAFSSPSRSPGVPWSQEIAPSSPWSQEMAPRSPWNQEVALKSPWNLESTFAFTSPSRNQSGTPSNTSNMFDLNLVYSKLSQGDDKSADTDGQMELSRGFTSPLPPAGVDSSALPKVVSPLKASDYSLRGCDSPLRSCNSPLRGSDLNHRVLYSPTPNLKKTGKSWSRLGGSCPSTPVLQRFQPTSKSSYQQLCTPKLGASQKKQLFS